MTSIKWCCILLMTFFSITTCFADNPVVQTCYTADPAPMVYNGRVYMYVDQDSANASGSYLLSNWKCYSSADMVNWTDHGVVFSPGSITWSTAKDADAAQVIYRNGKFYYYISTTGSSGVSIGVAVSNSPIGPFKDTLGEPLIPTSQMPTTCNANHSWRGLDPTVIIDDDGQAYLYWGNNVFYWVKLNANMISLSGSISCLAQNDAAAFGPDYEEGPWVDKRNGIYYLVYPSGLPECIRYTTSSGPTGPWTYKSQIMAQNGCSTIHPGVCDFNGNSYFFYHNAALPGGGDYKRSVCIERFTYNADGTIPTINGTTGGVTMGVGNLNPYDTTQAETICWESGVRTEVCSEGGMDVDSIHNGDYIKVKGVDFATGATSFIARVASATTGGNIEIHIDSLKGSIIATCAVTGTGGWQTWATKSCTVSGATGVHDLYLKFTGSGSGMLFNFNWWKFTPVQTEIGRMGTINLENGSSIKVIVDAGNSQTVRLDFSQPVSQEKLTVKLFDVTGRLTSTLFNGCLSSPYLTLPLNRKEIKPGRYMLSVSMGNKVISARNMLVQ